MTPKQLKYFCVATLLIALLAVACKQGGSGAANPTTGPILQPMTATNTPVLQAEPEWTVTAPANTSSPVTEQTLPTVESATQVPPTPETRLPATVSPDLPPLIMNRGAPANDRCVVNNPQPSIDVVKVYAAPDLQSALVAQLGNWADVLQTDTDWYKILIPQGGTGWVWAEHVILADGCAASPIEP